MIKIIGLTDGIGSGKSAIANIFESLHVPIFYADQAGREVLDFDPMVKNEVMKLLGDEAYLSGKANRQHIAEKVFSNDALLQSLNAIIHPAVKRAFLDWQANLPSNTAYCIREAAILFESGSHLDCDKVICVVAEDELRIKRVLDRDHANRAEVDARNTHFYSTMGAVPPRLMGALQVP